jgi:alkylation response protein AidB-like acyl-CoA dehydrogenase
MDTIKKFLQAHFSAVDQCDPYSEACLDEFLHLGPLHYFIPQELGGKSDGSSSYLDVVEIASYYSLPLGLTLGITGSLFILPMVKHAQPGLRDPIVRDFLQTATLGGMMITEPTGGTDIFSLNSHYTPSDDTLLLQGSKCWGGLTGKADHWLVAARLKRGDKLTKKLNLIYVPLNNPGVQVETRFDALGLNPIPYGLTRYQDTELPSEHLIIPKGKSGLRIIYDTLFRSRLGMPAIATGLCQRLADESQTRMRERVAFGRSLIDFDQVQYRVNTLQEYASLNKTLRRFTGDWMDGHEDISGHYTLVNAAKLVCSETMNVAADSAVQLFASAAFKRNHLVGRAFIDARPFRIFEGSNDVLDENTFEVIAARHGRCDRDTLEAEFGVYGLHMPTDIPSTITDLLPGKHNQRWTVVLGRLIAWICMQAIWEKTESADVPRIIGRRIAELAAALPYLD